MSFRPQSDIVSRSASDLVALLKTTKKWNDKNTYRLTKVGPAGDISTSFPESLILPPHRASGGGKMRDPGSEVGDIFDWRSRRTNLAKPAPKSAE